MTRALNSLLWMPFLLFFVAPALSFAEGNLAGDLAKESLSGPHIQVDWIAPESFPERGETLIGIRFRPDPDWHVYWKNPGDSGAAPKFEIQAEGAKVSGPLWPYPVRLPVAHLTNLGYEGETAYLFSVQTSGSADIRINAELEWLVCKEECIPGYGSLSLSRSARGESAKFKSEAEEQIRFYASRLPTPGKNSSYRLMIQSLDAESGRLQISLKSQDPLPNDIDLFPLSPDYVSPKKPEIQRTENEAIFSFDVPLSVAASSQLPESIGFILTANQQAFEFQNLSPSLTPPSFELIPLSTLSLLILSALLGGVLLNLMPCVFPVISMKAISLLKTKNAGERRRDGIHYSLGVLCTFGFLGGAFLVLRQLGEVVGWGFQLQSPLVIFLLILLFWLMALNFLGVFEFGTSIMNASGNVKWRSSFGTGVLSVFIAAPCTGPFMGSALGATATLPGSQALLIFLALGLGLAAPYLALTFIPSLARLLPKPGAWMETLKQFFAFPLFATVLWLAWVLGQQIGTKGWSVTALVLLGVSFALWLAKHSRCASIAAWLIALLSIAFAIPQILKSQTAEAATGEAAAVQEDWIPYSEEKLQSALKKGQPVFIDFTAAWCITCQVNKTTVLETDAIDTYFERANILRLRADWTRQDPAITKALADLGRNSVPVYAFYRGDGTPAKILPQILTPDMIKNLIPTQEKR